MHQNKLPKQFKLGVIEGDIASRIDTDIMLSQGYSATQINTGGNCHLDAAMIQKALSQLPLDTLTHIFI